MTINKNTLPDNLKENEMNFLGFANELRDCIDDCFDRRLCDLYGLLNIKDGSITPMQDMRLNNILTHFSDELTALAVELAAQNKPPKPRNESYDAVLAVLHKMYADWDASDNDNEKAQEFYDTDFSISFGDKSVTVMNSAMNFEAVEGCLLRLLSEIAGNCDDGYDYSDDYIVLKDGEVTFEGKEG